MKPINYKNQKGITLLALVITITVTIILAGISIRTGFFKNGVFDMSLKAKKGIEVAETEENIRYAALAASADGKGTIKQSALERELQIYLGKKQIEYELATNGTEGWTVTVPKDNIIYNIDAEGNIESQEQVDNSGSYALALIDNLGTRTTIYLYGNPSKQTTSTITTSLKESPTGSNVENTDAVIDTPSYEGALSDAANYVTYTVNKNGTYTFNITSDGETTETKVNVSKIEKFTKVDDMGLSYVNNEKKAYKYNGAAVPKGYYVDTKSKVETGLVVTDAIDEEGYSTGNEWVWVPVNSVVGNDEYYGEESGPTPLAGATDVTYTKYSKLYSFVDKTREEYGIFHPAGTVDGTLSRPSTTSSPNYREIAIVTSSAGGETENYNLVNSRTNGASHTNVTDVATQYMTDFDNMVAGVNNYKGFYIGRYEITANGEKPGITLVNKTWYELYNKCLSYGEDYTESGMIYGTLWDATMQWLAKSNYSVGYTGNTYSGYGNYITETINLSNNETKIIVKTQDTRQKFSTGQISYTRSNNVFDLSGNFWDWTQEAYSTGTRVHRGGNYYFDNGKNYTFSSSRSTSSPVSTPGSVTSRPCLYIK